MQITQLSLKIIDWALTLSVLQHGIMLENHGLWFCEDTTTKGSHIPHLSPKGSGGKLLKLSEMVHIAFWLKLAPHPPLGQHVNQEINLVAVACPTIEGERGLSGKPPLVKDKIYVHSVTGVKIPLLFLW